MHEAVARALLLTDVVDSTRLTEALGDVRMSEVWATHDRVARDLMVVHGGREIDRADGFLILFERAADAGAYALAYHRALADLSARHGLAFKARAGLHVGEVVLRENPPEDVRRGAKPLEVEGVAKSLAARVMTLAHGGQTLLTPAACVGLERQLPAGAELESHGHYRMKGLIDPLELYELGVAGEAPFVPPADGAKVHRVVRAGELWQPVKEVPHALPAERDAFVGRQAELLELSRRVDGGARLVTVLGPGGTGKTRLVRRYGWTWLGDWPGGVWFADLAEARSVDGIASAVGGALEVPLGKGDPIVQLGHAIAGRGRCLVVLDNFEQAVKHAEATVGRWLERAVDAAFVVTSREVLHVKGEVVMPLEPLDPDHAGLELFEVRARAQKPGFSLDPAGLREVREVVRLLDGMPLAIELAAARARVLSPAQILERMEDRFRLLTGARGAAGRQATLRAAIDWSWGLLEPSEQEALAQVSVFAGGFTMAAAEAVLAFAGPGAPWAMDVVQSLVDKSLLRSWTPGSSARRMAIEEPYFGMYMSIQEYAREKLRTEGAIEGASGAGAERAAESRHGAYFARFGSEQALESLDQHGGVARRRALGLELENLLSAAGRAHSRGDGGTAAAAFLAAWAVLDLQGPFTAAIELGRAVLALHRLDPAERSRVETSVSIALRMAGRMVEARRSFDEALASVRAARDRRREGIVLGHLGVLHMEQGRIDEARTHLESAVAIHREVGNRRFEGIVLGNLGVLHMDLGLTEAEQYLEQALVVHREIGNRRYQGIVLGSLGNLHKRQGRFDESRQSYEAALEVHREVGNRRFEGIALGNLGDLHMQQERQDEARAYFASALAIHREVGNRRSEGISLGNLGLLHMAEARLEEARAHFEAALTIAREFGDRHFEGAFLGYLGALELRLGNREQSRDAFARGEPMLREVGDRIELGKLLCSRGELELALGDLGAASAALAEAEALAAATQALSDCELSREIARLRQALGQV